MTYKYRVHVSDDNYNPVDVIQKLLIPDGIKSIEEDREEICLEWVDFKHFEHPGQAIEYYDTEGVVPDISIVDLNYTELDADDVPKEYKGNTSGVILIDYLLKKFGDNVSIIPYSAVLDDEVVVQALADRGFDEQAISKIKAITDTRTLKDEQPQLKIRVQKRLKELARLYFLRLSDTEYKRLEQEANNGDAAKWSNYPPIQFDHFDFSLDKMLLGWGNIANLNTNVVSNIIADLLEETERNYVFTGNWYKKDSNERKFLEEYLQLPSSDYKREKHNIDFGAFDYLLNVLLVKAKFEHKEEVYALNERNRNIVVTNGCKGRRSNQNFFYKLIGRRVVLGFSDSLGFVQESVFQKAELAALLRHGNTNTAVKKQDKTEGTLDINPIFNTNLGLTIDVDGSGKILTAKKDKTVMYEERTWLDTYGKSVKSMRAFLDELNHNVINDILSEYKDENIYAPPVQFIDLTELKEYFEEFRKKHPNLYSELKTETLAEAKRSLTEFGASLILRIL